METAKIAEPINGDKLYQQRAREALPILVRQAIAGKPIYYSGLASELGMPNPRNLNYVLGSIGTTLERLSKAKAWGGEVPPIQCLVINKNTGLPGEGVGWFITSKKGKAKFNNLSRKQKELLVDSVLQQVYTYDRWQEVLEFVGLAPIEPDSEDMLSTSPNLHGGGESEEHKKLKEYVATHPGVIGIKADLDGEMEHVLPSGDKIDVFFSMEDEHIAVEIKSVLSAEPDLIRGLFQCVKYLAVLEARQAVQALPQNSRAILVLGGKLPKKLLPIKHVLGVEVIENVEVI